LLILIVIDVNFELILYANVIFPKSNYSLMISKKKSSYYYGLICLDYLNRARIWYFGLHLVEIKKKFFMAATEAREAVVMGCCCGFHVINAKHCSRLRSAKGVVPCTTVL
jgi:hypothetical protein